MEYIDTQNKPLQEIMLSNLSYFNFFSKCIDYDNVYIKKSNKNNIFTRGNIIHKYLFDNDSESINVAMIVNNIYKYDKNFVNKCGEYNLYNLLVKLKQYFKQLNIVRNTTYYNNENKKPDGYLSKDNILYEPNRMLFVEVKSTYYHDKFNLGKNVQIDDLLKNNYTGLLVIVISPKSSFNIKHCMYIVN